MISGHLRHDCPRAIWGVMLLATLVGCTTILPSVSHPRTAGAPATTAGLLYRAPAGAFMPHQFAASVQPTRR